MHLIINGEKQAGRAHFKEDKNKRDKKARAEEAKRTPIAEVEDYATTIKPVEQDHGAAMPNPEIGNPFATAPSGFDSIAENFGDAYRGQSAPEVIGDPMVLGGDVPPEAANNDVVTMESSDGFVVGEVPADQVDRIIEAFGAGPLATSVTHEDSWQSPEVIPDEDAAAPRSEEKPKKGLSIPKKEREPKAVDKPAKQKKTKEPKKGKAAEEDDILAAYADVELVQRDRLTFGFMIAIIALIMVSAAAGAFFHENIMALLKPMLGV